jgi:hypothetical protein
VVVADVMRMGGKDALIDRVGREMLTVWIPLDHDLSEADRAFGRRLGEGMKNHVVQNAVLFGGVNTSPKQIGVVVIGKDADALLDAIRPYFKQHCPRGTFVTRQYVHKRGDDKEAALHRWARPKPLFEDDVIPDSA